MVVMDVGDVAVLRGLRLDVDVVAAGRGRWEPSDPCAGRPAQPADRGSPSRRGGGRHGAAFNVVPATWAPPATWRMLGTEDGAVVYEP